MLKRWSWLTLGMVIVMGAFAFSAQAKSAPKVIAVKADEKKAEAKPAASEDADSEAGLDLTLRTKGAAMPIKTADGSALESPASHIMLLDYDTGTILADKASGEKMYPSSMTKMMTLYIVFDGLKKGTLSLTNEFTVSPQTWVKWNNRGSSMFLPINSQVGLEDLIRGIAIQSGNDACVVVAEGIAGSEEAFAKIMNETAKNLGMTNSNFTDSTGWPNPNHTTTAHDLAVLAQALIRDFPEYYHYLSEREFSFHNIRQFNRNLLLGNASMKVDGLKTGHTDAAGYGITLSAVDPASGRREVLVINGLNSEAERASEGERLLRWGFNSFKNAIIFKADQEIVKAKVWMGKDLETPLTIAKNIKVSIPKTGDIGIKASATYQGPLIAPIKKGTEVGKLTLTFADGTTQDVPLIAAADVEKLGFFARIPRGLGL